MMQMFPKGPAALAGTKPGGGCHPCQNRVFYTTDAAGEEGRVGFGGGRGVLKKKKGKEEGGGARH